jgi:transcriptional regulator with XRE-family HTH domain
MMTFGEIISKARKEKGLNQKQLAALIKKEDGQAISAPYLNDIEHDRRSPSSDRIIEQFAAALDLEPETLYFAARRLPPYIYKTPADEKVMAGAIRALHLYLQKASTAP